MDELRVELMERLEQFGITDWAVADEGKPQVLHALNLPGIKEVYIDPVSNHLCIDFGDLNL